MKNLIKKLSLILIFAMIISGIQSNNVLATSKKYVKSLTISKKSLSISVGESVSLSYKVKVKGKASKKIIAKASNANVKVTSSKSTIKILGKKQGNAKVTILTKGKNKKGKKIKKIVKIKITKGNTPAISEPESPEVTKAECISAIMEATGYSVQKELFDYNEKGEIFYHFTDIAENDNAAIIETAVKYGIIPEAGGIFNPDDAANREFLAVTSVRAVGLATDELEVIYSDKDDLKYKMEDVVAVQLGLLELSDNKFFPSEAVTKAEKQNAVEILSDIIESRKINKNHKDVIKYSEDVTEEKDIKDYIVAEYNGEYSITIPEKTFFSDIVEGNKIILPATESYPNGIALIVNSNMLSSDGENRIITGTVPEEISEFVDSVDIEGVAEPDAKDITAVEGVAVVEVTAGLDKEEGIIKGANAQKLKKASIDGEIDLKDKTQISYTVKEIETTISFYLSELKYNIDFDKKGVNKIYIGLPSVLSLETNYKAKKNFSKKIGDIPINLSGGFSANIEVYLEADISGEITMDLRLSNNIGIQYYNGRFYVEKSCEPSIDMLVDADIDAGVKLQLALYWMKGIKELFGKSDPRPVYNVFTKWGLHGNAAMHIRNDQYTLYENLVCVDLAYYLYGTVNVGDGSFLGDTFGLTKMWTIFNDENSPLKGTMHIENGKQVFLCTYKTDTNIENAYTLLQFGEDNIEESYQGTTYHCNISSDGNITFNITYKDKNIKINTKYRYIITILTNGQVIYYTDNYAQESTVYKMDLDSEIKTKLFSEYFGNEWSSFNLMGCYNNNLYYTKNIVLDTLYKYNIKMEKETKIVLLDGIEGVDTMQYGQYLITAPYRGEYWYFYLKTFDMENEKTTMLSDKVLGYEVIDNKIYIVIYKKAYGDKNTDPMADCICDVIKCDLNGQNAINLLSDVHVRGYISEITESYIKTSLWNWEDDTSQDFILNYS